MSDGDPDNSSDDMTEPQPELVYPGDILGCRKGARLLLLLAFVIILVLIVWAILMRRYPQM